MDPVGKIIKYHEETKHHFQRPARGPGYMDWANQPNPFRKFFGAPFIPLPRVTRDESPSYLKLFSDGAMDPAPLTIHTISRFFELSLSISAWKQFGDSRWALRCNPSSGNLHPTEGYAVLPAVDEIHAAPGVYHYAPREHGLERRTEFSNELWLDLMKGFPEGSFLAGFSSIHWREAWKYGERAFRYCQHDIGHALAAYRIAAAGLGWNLVLMDGIGDDLISTLFGLDRNGDFEKAEKEHPDLVALVFPGIVKDSVSLKLCGAAIKKIGAGVWLGKANGLSSAFRPWEIIEMVSAASLKTCEDFPQVHFEWRHEIPIVSKENLSAREKITTREIVRQRRSAVAMDGRTTITRADFYAALAQTLHRMPMDSLPWSPRIHLCLYVHRVREVPPGLYFLARDPAKLPRLQESCYREFLWEKPDGCPEWMELYLLQEGDLRRTSAMVSCTQDIAGQGVFSLGMIAEFESSLKEFGPWFYRRLFWESGMVGQMLYLAAEFMGIRSTGIGCYFDDPVHQILGIQDKSFQSLYHFTLGGPVDDTRLTTLPPYPDE